MNPDANSNDRNVNQDVDNLENCSICLQKPLYPAKLPCGHVIYFHFKYKFINLILISS